MYNLIVPTILDKYNPINFFGVGIPLKLQVAIRAVDQTQREQGNE